MIYGVLGAVFTGCTTVILPRWDRGSPAGSSRATAGLALTRIPTMIIDLFASPNYKGFDLSSLRNLSGGGAAMPQAVAQRLQDEFGLTFAEGLRPHRDRRAQPRQPARARQAAVPGHPDLRRRLARRWIRSRCRSCRRARPARSSPTGRWCSRLLEATPEATGRPPSRRCPATAAAGSSSAPATSAAWTRKATLPHRSPQAHDQRERLQRSGRPRWRRCCSSTRRCRRPASSPRDEYRGETVKAVVVLRAEARGKTAAEDITAWAREHMAAYRCRRSSSSSTARPSRARAR